MCLMLYLASGIPIPLRETPELTIEHIESGYEAVCQWFSLPEVRYAGAHTGCSCGFPSVIAKQPVEYHDGMFDDDEDRAGDLASLRALFAVLDELLASTPAVELFPIWVGDESDPPIGMVPIARGDLAPERFAFTRHFLYRVTR